jgi:hypothetical protein
MCYVNSKLLAHIKDKPYESIDLLDDSITSAELLKELYRLRDRRFLSACRNCNGYLTDSKHQPPAVQLQSKKEIF